MLKGYKMTQENDIKYLTYQPEEIQHRYYVPMLYRGIPPSILTEAYTLAFSIMYLEVNMDTIMDNVNPDDIELTAQSYLLALQDTMSVCGTKDTPATIAKNLTMGMCTYMHVDKLVVLGEVLVVVYRRGGYYDAV